MNRKIVTIWKNRNKVSRNMQSWFCILSFLGVLVTLIGFFMTHGALFSKVFFQDPLDTGMDFFHSIEYLRGRAPYDLYGTLYPPLANFFFYLLYRFVPLEQINTWQPTFDESVWARGSSTDLRVWQPTMMLFICYILLTSIMLVLLVQSLLKYSTKSGLVGLCMVLSYGVLYSFERGNIIFVSMLCCMFFVFFKDSENKVLSELALIALAIGAGLKIYPALFGMILIYDKQYAKAARAVLYGIIAFVAPVFIFREGIGALRKFVNILLSFIGTSEITSNAYSFDKILNVPVLILRDTLGFEINAQFWLALSKPLNTLTAILALICGFCLKKKWQKALTCTLSFLLYQAQGIYALAFFLIPFVLMLKEEENICKANFLPYITLVFTQILLPIYDVDNMGISMMNLRFQICMLILFAYVLVLSISAIKQKFKSRIPALRGQ